MGISLPPSPYPMLEHATSVEHLKEFHERYHVPGNTLLAVVGDVKADEFLDHPEEFRRIEGPACARYRLDPPADAAPAKIYLVDRPVLYETNIVAGDYGRAAKWTRITSR